MKYIAEVAGGRTFEIEVQRKGDADYIVSVDGREIEAEFIAVDNQGQFAASLGHRSFAPSINEDDQQHLRVTLGRDSFRVYATDERERAASEIGENVAKSETLLAPMPGIVIGVNVEVGDTVEAGQCVCILEAMKMQNEITAKHGGVVEAVMVSSGQSVSGNDPLVLLSNEDE